MKSIGQILKNARQKKNFTIEDVQKFIKIHPQYLRALENDDYAIFEGKVHSKGFLKIYADFLDLDLEEIIALWRREYESSFEKKSPGKVYKLKSLEPERFVITPSILITTVLGLVLCSFFLYLFLQYKHYTDAPDLDIYYPNDNQVLPVNVLDITGKTAIDSEVFINEQKIIANPDGSFVTSLKLKEGINTISIKAVNKLNKSSEKIRTVIYRPEVKENIELEKSLPSTDINIGLEKSTPAAILEKEVE